MPASADQVELTARECAVVKIGGSLMGSDRLSTIAAALARARRPVVVVPGGGGFADEVRSAQIRHGISDRAAHAMALLSMHQTGLLLADLQRRFVPVETLAAVRRTLDVNRIPVWLPYRSMIADAAVPADWTTTSDGLAARLAERMRLRMVILIKSRVVPAGQGAAELADQGIVDPTFADIVARARLSFRVFGPGEERELAAVCRSSRAPTSSLRRQAGRTDLQRRQSRRGGAAGPRG
ncbi:MAG: uridylate kinase [Hyphomicrobiaceae bacterium]